MPIWPTRLPRKSTLQHCSRGEAWGVRLQLLAERDVQAVGEEGDEDMRLDSLLVLMEDGPDCEIALERLEGGFDLDELQVELPEFCGVGLGEIRAQ